MKKVLIGSVLVSGLLFAKDMQKTQRLSGNERAALNTQSPRVHTKHHKNREKNTRTDHVTKDKHTINAYVPNGK